MSQIERFDGSEAWKRLDEDMRDQIGAAALEAAVAWHALLELEPPVSEKQQPIARAAESAMLITDRLLRGLVGAALPEQLAPGRYPLPSALGRICRVCGCTQEDACPGGCAWAEEDLCTACVKPEVQS